MLRRAIGLHIKPNQPLAAFQSNSSGSFTFLHSSDIITVVHQAVVTAYPDPTRHYRVNIKAIVAHSNRVAAAVALCLVKLTIEEIAFRPRWKPDSDQHYIRECSQLVDNLTLATISGAAII